MLRALVYVVPIALLLYALIDLSRSEPVERAGLRPIAWVAIIVLLPVIGPVAWIVVSRSRRSPGGRSAGPSSGPRRPGPGRPQPRRRSGPVAPDDDPDFLWRLEQQRRRERKAGPAAGSGSGTDAGGATGSEAGDAGQDPAGTSGTEGADPGGDDRDETWPDDPRGDPA